MLDPDVIRTAALLSACLSIALLPCAFFQRYRLTPPSLLVVTVAELALLLTTLLVIGRWGDPIHAPTLLLLAASLPTNWFIVTTLHKTGRALIDACRPHRPGHA